MAADQETLSGTIAFAGGTLQALSTVTVSQDIELP